MKDRIATIGVWLVLATLIASVDINHRKRLERLEKQWSWGNAFDIIRLGQNPKP